MDVKGKVRVEGVEVGVSRLGWPKPLADLFERWRQRMRIANQIGMITSTVPELEALMQDIGLNDRRFVLATAMTMAGVDTRGLENLLHTFIKTADQLAGIDEPDMTEPPMDFVHRWSESAKVAGEDELREMFASILAGEIRNPGRVSYCTIEVTKSLDPGTAAAFQKWASMGILIGGSLFLCTIGRNPNLNELRHLGFGFPELNQLQHVGLIGADYRATYDWGRGHISNLGNLKLDTLEGIGGWRKPNIPTSPNQIAPRTTMNCRQSLRQVQGRN